MKGLFIPEITAEMFRNFCLESIEELMAEGEIYDIEYEPCGDCINRQAALDAIDKFERECPTAQHASAAFDCEDIIKALPPVTPSRKIGHCKDCKWWKDSDGVYRRGVKAESQCPINRREVFDGNGYCYMFKPQESEDNA